MPFDFNIYPLDSAIFKIFDKIQMNRHDECPSCGLHVEQKDIKIPSIMVEELCGRDRGKRTYTVTPAQITN